MDFETFYDQWLDAGNESEPTWEDHQDWLYDRADLALGG